MRKLLTALILAALMESPATGAAAQTRDSGQAATTAKTALRLFVSLSDQATLYFPVRQHRLIFYRSPTDSTVVTTDSTGSASVDLVPGDYRVVSAQPVSWHGDEYTWNRPITVRAGQSYLDLRAADASRRVGSDGPVAQAAVPITASGTQQPAMQRRTGDRPTRHGFWFNVGLGAGSLGCDDCVDRATGLSGGLGIGGTINPHVRLGALTSGWYKSENGATLNAGVLLFGVRFYPSETGGFFLLGGLGLSSVNVTVRGLGSGSVNGSGALLGIGWDIDMSNSISLTPFWNGIGISASDGTANYGQIGLGLTIH